MLRNIRRSLRFLSTRERVLYGLIIAARMIIGVLDVVGIVLIGLIASVLATRLQDGVAAPVEIAGIVIPALDATGVLVLVACVLAAFVLKAALAVSLTRLQTGFVARAETRAAARITAALIGGTLDDAKRHTKAEVQFAVTGSSTFAFTGLLNNVVTLCAESFLLLLVVGALMFVDPVVAVFALAYFGVFVIVVQLLINASLKRSGQEAVEGTLGTIAGLSDSLDAFREIAVQGKQRAFIERIGVRRRQISHSGAVMTFLAAMPRYVVETALILGVLLLVGQQMLAGDVTSGFGTIGVFLAGGVRVMASLLPLQSAVSNLRQNAEQAQTSLDLLDELADAPELHEPAPADTPLPDGALGVTLRDVAFRYARAVDTDTLVDIDLEIAPGSYAAVVGPSGAGKTTLVDLILGLVEPRAGSVEIAGAPPARLRAAHPGVVGYVPQKPGLVTGSILENIALGVPADEIDRARVEEVLEAAFLADFVASLPEGADTSVGAQSDALSGGQIQRLGIARALYSQPRLLVMDEATSGLDAGSEAAIARTLEGLRGEVTVVVVAHRLSTVQRADAVHVVDAGRIVASGSFREVVAANPTVAEYVRLMTFDHREEES
jgi:ATP-binding cassette subfamily C protein